MQSISHHARYNDDGSISIYYNIQRSSEVKIDVFTYMGHYLETITNDYKSAGENISMFTKDKYSIGSTIFIYKIQAGKQQVSGKVFCR